MLTAVVNDKSLDYISKDDESSHAERLHCYPFPHPECWDISTKTTDRKGAGE